MILFYAQSENSEIVVTSPRLTFPGGVSAAGNVAEPYLYGVQPISYTLPDGTSYLLNLKYKQLVMRLQKPLLYL